MLQNRWRRNADFNYAPTDEAKAGVEFEKWREQSETEQRQRLEINRQLLANRLEFLKLQAGWLKPYLPQFHQSDPNGNPALVTAFNTAVFELVLLVELPAEIEQSVKQGDLPKMLLGKSHRQCRPLLVVEFRFRAIPERTKAGSYAHRGRAELTFTSYALNDDELAVLRREIKRNEYGQIFQALEQKTSTAMQKLLGDLDDLFAGDKAQPKETKPANTDGNPFSALFSILEWFKSSPTEPAEAIIREPLRPDSVVERVLRSCAVLEGRSACRKLFEWEKRRRQMPVEKR